MKIIAITGPESTGKTTLAGDLAQAYHADYVPEFARIYLQNLGRPYTEQDLLTIARGQVALQAASMNTITPYLFWDTDLSVIQIWSHYKYGRVHPWIRKKRRQQKIDLYVLTHYDIPYEEDPLREHPEKREELYHVYRGFLTHHNLPFIVAQGDRMLRCTTVQSYLLTHFK